MFTCSHVHIFTYSHIHMFTHSHTRRLLATRRLAGDSATRWRLAATRRRLGDSQAIRRLAGDSATRRYEYTSINVDELTLSAPLGYSSTHLSTETAGIRMKTTPVALTFYLSGCSFGAYCSSLGSSFAWTRNGSTNKNKVAKNIKSKTIGK